MKIEGRVFKNKQTGKFYGVEIPALGIHTQGKSLKEAYVMAKDAIETAVDKADFNVEIFPISDSIFHVAANNPKYLIASILKAQRLERGLTAKEIVTAMGERSETGYLRYERGESSPSFEKLEKILRAMDPELEPVLKIG